MTDNLIDVTEFSKVLGWNELGVRFQVDEGNLIPDALSDKFDNPYFNCLFREETVVEFLKIHRPFGWEQRWKEFKLN